MLGAGLLTPPGPGPKVSMAFASKFKIDNSLTASRSEIEEGSFSTESKQSDRVRLL